MQIDQLLGAEPVGDVVEQLCACVSAAASLAGVTGEMRMPVLSPPISLATAAATSSISLARFSSEPP
jgi:hypothetical protein